MSETAVTDTGRRQRSRAEADGLVREFAASGLTRAAFCAGHGLSVTTLDKYRRRHAQEAAGGVSRLVSVEVAPEVATGMGGGSLWVELRNGRRIGVGSRFDTGTLERLLAVLESA